MNAADKLRIYQEAKKELERLHEEDRIASIEQQKRTQAINEAYAVITFLSKGLETPDGAEPFMQSTPEEDFKESIKDINYPIDGTWQEKIKSVIKHAGKVLKIADMVNIMSEAEKKGLEGYTTAQILGVVSNNTSKMAKEGILGVYKSPKKEKGYYYGSPLWWNGNELKEEYLPETKIKSLW